MISRNFLQFCIFCIFIFPAMAQQTINGTLVHDGVTREYILYIPASYTAGTAVPVLFNFHGYTSNAGQQLFYGDFRSIADTANFILVLPNGTLDDSGVSHFNVGLTSSSTDDLGYTGALLDYLITNYAVDESRVYSTGMSNGGFMSYYLACNMSNRFAAIGSVTGTMMPAWLTNCAAQHQTPVIEIHGTNDPTVPYNGTAGMASIANVVNYWVGYNNCAAVPVVTNLPNTSLVDGSTVEKSTYLNGDNCSEVVHLKVVGGSHTWPGSIIPLAGTNFDINASVEVWKFVSRFNMNGLIGCPTNDISELNKNEFELFPNPTTGFIHVKGYFNSNVNYKLFSTNGSLIRHGNVTYQTNQIDLNSLEKGVYFMQINDEIQKIIKME